MTFRRWQFLVLALIFGSCGVGFLLGLRTYTYHGQVVDEASGAPLAGAVITVIWSHRPFPSYEGGGNFFFNAQETLTGADGKFSLRVSSGLDWDPGSLRNSEPWIVVYQPGYEPLTQVTRRHQGFETNDDFIRAFESGVTVRLRKPNNKDIWIVTDLAVVGSLDPPLKRIPNLIRAINVQRKMAGFDPFIIDLP